MIFNQWTLIYIEWTKKILYVGETQYPFVLFCLFHGFLAFSLVHFLLLWYSIDEVSLELVYQFLNGFRLILFPCFIAYFFFSFAPFSFKMEPGFQYLFDDLLKPVAKEFVRVLTEKANFKKNPKTAAALYGVAGLGAVCASHKQGVQDTFDETCRKVGLNIADPPESIATDPEALLVYKEAVYLLSKTTGSMVTLTLNDFGALVTFNPTTRKKIHQCLTDLKCHEAVHIVKKRQLQEGFDLSMSSTARASIQSDELPSESIVVDPKIPTVLEDVFRHFFL